MATKETKTMPKKTSGISAVYSSVTGTIVNTCDVINILASAGKQLAMNAESAAMAARVNNENELIEALGDIDAEKLAKVQEMKNLLRNM